MVAAVQQRHSEVDDRIAGQYTGGHGLLDTLVDAWDVLLWDPPTADLVDELVSTTGTGRLDCREQRERTDPYHRSA